MELKGQRGFALLRKLKRVAELLQLPAEVVRLPCKVVLLLFTKLQLASPLLFAEEKVSGQWGVKLAGPALGC